MSANAGNREVAHRVFAAEYDGASYEYSESDEERAPNYVVTPTGARVNRLFFVGVLTEVERVGDEVLRARVADPTGVFVVYAGQYQPDEMAFLERAEPPTFVAVTGKARTFRPDDSNRVFTSVRPESINEVDAETRDRWTVAAAEHTLARVGTFAAALDLGIEGDGLRSALEASGVPESLAAGIPIAREQYGTTEGYLAEVRGMAVDALGLVAGEVGEVDSPGLEPGDRGPGTVDLRSLTDVPGAIVDLRSPDSLSVDDAEDARSEAVRGSPATSGDSDLADGTGASAGEDDSTPEETGGTTETEPDDATETEPADPEDPSSVETTRSADVGSSEPESDAPEPESDAPESAEPVAADQDDDLGDFEPGEVTMDEEPPEEVLDDEERERIEEEFGTEFSTGSEVDEPGTAGIEPEDGPIGSEPGPETDPEPAAEPDSEPEPKPTSELESEPEPEAEAASSSKPATEADSEPDSEPEPTSEPEPEDVDLEDAAVEAMEELDDGDGADREAVVAAVVERSGADPGAVEDAIADALMAGRCFEPGDELLKSI